MIKRLLGVAAAGLLAVVGTLVQASPAAAAPTFRVPFHCGQTWAGQTRTNHSPLYAVDFNRSGDLGDHVLASAAGTVSVVRNLGSESYGRYVVVNHGNGWSTLYAHLSGFNVSVGQDIAADRVIGYVGESGNVSGPHLHYEQRYNGNDVKAKFGASTEVYYFGTRNYERLYQC